MPFSKYPAFLFDHSARHTPAVPPSVTDLPEERPIEPVDRHRSAKALLLIFFKGIFTGYYRLVALSLIVVFVYGSMLWYIFPVMDDISWEGHLGGFVTGLFLAAVLKTPIPQAPKYIWESGEYQEDADPFMRHFDADGNFIENPEGTEEPQERFRVRYHYRRKEEK